MNALDRLLIGCILLAAILIGCALGVRHYGAERYQAGQAAAVAAGDKLRKAEADRNIKTESDLRAQLHAQDADALKKEQSYATNLEAAQRRVRTGVDRLLCPASAISAGAAPADRSVTAGADVDGEGPELVPEAAAEVLGDGADVAGLVRRYERVIQRFEACRTVTTQ